MPDRAHTKTKAAKVVPALLLVFIFLFTSLACAGMAAARLPAAHPCCPPTEHHSQDNCLKMRCISTAPALLPPSTDNRAQISAVVSVAPVPAAYDSWPQSSPDAALGRLPHELFLNHHQFRI